MAVGGEFLLGNVLLVGCVPDIGWPHTHAHMGNTNWTQGIINNKKGRHDVCERG